MKTTLKREPVCFCGDCLMLVPGGISPNIDGRVPLCFVDRKPVKASCRCRTGKFHKIGG